MTRDGMPQWGSMYWLKYSGFAARGSWTDACIAVQHNAAYPAQRVAQVAIVECATNAVHGCCWFWELLHARVAPLVVPFKDGQDQVLWLA